MGDIMLVHSTSMSPVIITTNESSDATAMIERFWIDTLTSARIHMLQADSPKCTYSFKYEFNRKTPKCLLHLCQFGKSDLPSHDSARM